MENSNPELESMRAQLALLKDKLNSEEIINERLLRETMKTKGDSINREAIWSIIASVLVILMMFTSFHPMGFSWEFCIGTIIFMLICVGATLYQHRDVNSRTFDGDLLTVARTMRRLKKNYRDWLKFSFPAVTLWFGWMGYEVYRMSQDWIYVVVIMGCGVLGGVVGGIFGFRSYRKVLRTCDEIINSIEQE